MRLLLVEDEDDLADQLKIALSEKGFVVDRAADGADGLDRALAASYDVIVLDLMLPKLDGRALLRHLRRESDTPVLVLTARDALDDCVGGLEDGADDYLTKPFELRELVARLRVLVRRKARSAADEIAFGALVVDLRRSEARLAGAAVELTVQEYRLLEVLALERGEPISRDELWHRLSGSDEDVGSNVVAVHVHNLRAKLGAGCIRTRHGFGYALADPDA